MNVRRMRVEIVILMLAPLVLIATLVAVAAQTGDPVEWVQPVRADDTETLSAVDPSTIPVMEADSVLRPGQVAETPEIAGLVRVVSQSWEDSRVLNPNQAWRAFDSRASQPSINDIYRWGRRDCVSTTGDYSLWSVGGGIQGGQLGCSENYPSPIPEHPQTGLRTELQYLTVDMAAVPPDGGLRITFDYMANMPEEALFVGAGEFVPGEENTITGSASFNSDTGGEWVRGEVLEITDNSQVKVTGSTRVLVGFIYRDPPGNDGMAPPSSDSYGVYIDNIHLDVMFAPNLRLIPSPPTPSVTVPVPSDTPTASSTPISIPPTRTPRPTSAAMLPRALNVFLSSERTPPPTAPSPTITLTPEPTDTVTPTPTNTLPPSATPTRTPIPTNTRVPYPDVVFHQVAPLGNPEIVRVINQGTAPQDMTNWRVFEKRRANNCYFPEDYMLAPDEIFEFQSGGNAQGGEGIEVCNSSLIWDNNLDEAQLWTADNNLKDRWCYERNGSYPCDIPTAPLAIGEAVMDLIRR